MPDKDPKPTVEELSDTPATDGVGGIDVPVEMPVDFGAGEAEHLQVRAAEPQLADAVPDPGVQSADHTSEHAVLHAGDLPDPLAKHRASWAWAILGGAALVGIFAFVVYTLQHSSSKVAAQTPGKAVYSIPLGDLAKSGILSVDATSQLAINGQLRINNSLILSPIAAPANPVAGQMYLNKDDSQIYFYNGSSYVNIIQSDRKLTAINGRQVNLALGNGLSLSGDTLSATGNPFTLQGQSGDVTLTNGGGISITGTTITNTGVTAIGGQSGSVSLSGGSGIGVNGLAITNTGVVGLVSASDTITVAHDAAGNYTITQVGVDAGNKVSLAPATAQADSSNNPSMWINKTGTGNMLQLSTGATPVDRFVVDQSGAIIAGTIGFNQVTSKPNFINSIDATSGDFLLGTGLTRTGHTISNSGILSVAGTLHQVTVTGTQDITLALPQNIDATASPTFAALTLTSPLATTSGGTGAVNAAGARGNLGAAASGANSDITSLIGLLTPLSVGQGGTGAANAAGARTNLGAAASGANSDITSLSALSTAVTVGQGGTGASTAGGARTNLGAAASGANSDITSLTGVTSIAPSVGLTVGSTSQSLVLQGSTISVSATSGGNTATVGFVSPTGTRTINFPNESGTLCIQGSANCSFAATSGSANYIQNQNASPQATASFNIANTGTAVTFNATTGLNTGAGAGTVRIDAAGLLQNVTADVSILTSGSLSVARGGTGAGTFTSNGIIYGNGTGALQVTAVGSTGQCLTGNSGAAPTWGACGAAPTLQNAYDSSSTPATITTSSASKGVVVQSGTGNNSATAFQVNNAAGASVFNVDTANGRVGIGTYAPTVELQVLGNVNATTGFSGGSLDVSPLPNSGANKYVWSASVGWIDLNPTYGNGKIYPDHMEGYAYGENVGWIRLGTRTTGGVYSYPNSTATNYGVNRNPSTGALTGYAWSTNTGWINFSDTNSNVVHDPVTFQYSGYAWAENISWIHFKGTAADTTPYTAAANFGDHTVKAGDITATSAAISGNLSVMGNTGLGVASPTLRLQVSDSQASGYVTSIINTSTTTTAKGLLIGLGIANASRDPNNYFIGFADAAGNVAGKIQGGASAVAYTTTSADYAEYFKADKTHLPQPGELVILDTTQAQSVKASTSNVQAPLAGIVSTNPGFIGNTPVCNQADANCDADYAKTNALVALSGQVPAKLNTTNGPIAIGDPISASTVSGEGAKATGSGYIVGYALEPLATGSGTIKVLVRPQHYSPGSQDTLQGSNLDGGGAAAATSTATSIGGNLSTSGNTTLASLTVSGPATFTGDVTVKNITVANITVNGHIITSGQTPIATPGQGAGRADIVQNLPDPTVAIVGNDTSGTITITVGANATADKLATITFATPFASRPRISLTPITPESARLQPYAGNPGPASFDIGAAQAPIQGKTYQFDYHIMQ